MARESVFLTRTESTRISMDGIRMGIDTGDYLLLRQIKFSRFMISTYIKIIFKAWLCYK